MEVLITLIETLALDNFGGDDRELDPRHNLGPLPWTHTKPPELTIGPGVIRTVDLGYVVESDEARPFTIPMPSAPFSGAQYLLPGSYRIELAVVASDMDAERYEMTLLWDGAWLGEPPLSDHLKIEAPHRT